MPENSRFDPVPLGETEKNSLTEIGRTGLYHAKGIVGEEFLRQLKGRNAYKMYREMSENDPIIGACINAIESMVKRSEWTVKAADDSNEAERAAEFIRENLDDMEKSFPQFVSSAMSKARYGFSLFEILYKRRNGNIFDEEMGSKYNDNRIGWRDFAFRSQDTVWEWDFDVYGRIDGIVQQSPPDYQVNRIPGWKLLHFRTSHYKDNPEGKSALRNAFVPYFYKKNLQEIEAIGIERDLNGIPTAWVPAGMLSDNATEQEKQTVRAIQQMIRNTKQDKEAGLILPLAYDNNGNKMYDFELMSSRGRRTHDTSGIIMRYNRDIAASMLADFILIGHENVGSFALASAKTHLFSVALAGYLDEIRDVINKKAIPRLMRLNGMTEVPMPKIVYSDIETVELDDLARYVTALSGSGIDLTGEDVQEHLKDQAGIKHTEHKVVEDDDDIGEDD